MSGNQWLIKQSSVGFGKGRGSHCFGAQWWICTKVRSYRTRGTEMLAVIPCSFRSLGEVPAMSPRSQERGDAFVVRNHLVRAFRRRHSRVSQNQRAATMQWNLHVLRAERTQRSPSVPQRWRRRDGQSMCLLVSLGKYEVQKKSSCERESYQTFLISAFLVELGKGESINAELARATQAQGGENNNELGCSA